MPKYGLIACFSPVIKVNIGEHVRRVPVAKIGIGKWKKIGVLAIQKVAKTGNIGKKKTPVAGNNDYVRYLSMQKVSLNQAWRCMKWHKVKSKQTLEI